MVSPGLLERMGAEIGEDVVLVDSDRAFTVTGTLRRADADPEDPEVFLPAQLADVVGGQERWFEAKPARVRIKARPLKKLKDAAA